MGQEPSTINHRPSAVRLRIRETIKMKKTREKSIYKTFPFPFSTFYTCFLTEFNTIFSVQFSMLSLTHRQFLNIFIVVTILAIKIPSPKSKIKSTHVKIKHVSCLFLNVLQSEQDISLAKSSVY